MAKTRFVFDKEPRRYAEQLRKLQEEIAKAKAQIAVKEKAAAQLTAYLLRVGKGKSFHYNGPLYEMEFKVTKTSRMIMDQDKVKKMLKSKTPYRESISVSTKVDFVYED